MKRKENIIILGFAGILLCIIFIIVFLAFQSGGSINQPSLTPTPSITSTPSLTKNNILFNAEAERKLLDKLIKRESLSQTDALVKTKILSILPSGKESGVVYQSSSVVIEYVAPVDQFQGQIVIHNLDQAKAEAVAWFKSQGMGIKGICDLPLNFFMNIETARYVQVNKIVFSVLPNECL